MADDRMRMLQMFTEAGDDKERWIELFRQARAHTVLGPLDIELVDIGEEQAVLRMPITDAVKQPFGLLHGGVNMVLAETAASMHACWGTELTKRMPVGIEINGSHLRPASDGTVRTVARVVRRSRSLVVHQVEISHIESGKLLCTARVTNYYKELAD